MYTRKKDDILNIGIIGKPINDTKMQFYCIDSSVLNTFSKQEAEVYEKKGYKIINIIDIEVVPINDILNKYFKGKDLDFLNVDVEGLDFDIISNIDYSKYRPLTICVETYNFAKNMIENEIIDFLKSKNYLLYANTHLNSIFVDEQKYSKLLN